MTAWNSFLAIAVFAFLLGGEAQAQDTAPSGVPNNPIWEFGVAAGGFYSPDYPAADKNSLHLLPMPYLIYHGDFFRMGRDSIAKGVFFENELLEFNVSLAASFKANSGDIDARRGMPDLDYLGEIGPQAKIKLGTWYGGNTEIQLPVRAVFSTDFGRVDHRGFLFNPKLFHQRRNIFNSRINMSGSIGSSFATKTLHEYFYRVEPQLATSTRPSYEAGGGYLGSDLVLGISYGITDRLRTYAGYRLGYYGGSANEASPLFRQEINSSIYVGFTWLIYQSSTRVLAN